MLLHISSFLLSLSAGSPFLFCYFMKNMEIGIYIYASFVYDKGEQSRRPRVKCCQDGELCDRRRALPAMRYPHPLHIMETSFMESDTRSGMWPASLCCPYPVGENTFSPCLRGMGFFSP